ncbi:hypothetical protein B0H13DRAFT_2312743 [Mycena leptocephala]|nr:hypothetical protein B0H13DRAFT_2312743 [Mycena leptocephala]
MVRLDSSSAELRQSHRAKGFDPDRRSQWILYLLADPVNINADGEKHVHESTTAGEEPGPAPSLRDEMPVSQTFRFFMNVQGMLFLFLPSSWLYDQL